jgi:hypothetical protein
MKIDWNRDYSVRYILEYSSEKRKSVERQLVPDMFKNLTRLILEAECHEDADRRNRAEFEDH